MKFLADEEMMEADKNNKDYKDSYMDPFGVLVETRNFKRTVFGIYPKSGPTFPSMIVILDRRGKE